MEKKQVKVPKYLIAIIIIVLLSAVFLIAVMVPFLQQKPDYDEKHESAEKEKAMLNPYVDNKETIQASLDVLKADYSKKNKVIFENAKKTPLDVRDIIKKYSDVRFVSLVLSEGAEEGAGITTVEGGALKSSGVSLVLNATASDLLNILDYIEIKANGTYYIAGFSSEKMTEDIEDENGNKIEVSASETDRYNYSLDIRLYYFEDVTGLYEENPEESAEETSGEVTEESAVSAA